MKLVQQFLLKFYNDTHSRRLIFGINPGRLGAGITGVNFTAPRQLTTHCNIEHSFGNQNELSAEFIYEIIEQYGGCSAFYRHWFIGSVCPLGFVKNGKNLNYYDDNELLALIEPFIIESMQQLLRLNFKTDYCLCLGGAKNYYFLRHLNEKYQWFQNIIALPHPRFVMQYKRKEKQDYIQLYLSALNYNKADNF